jgi:2,4-dienoyl-CoA reductase (NADPH2)
LARGRALSERHVAYYAERAAGGTGVLVTEVASITADDWPYERAPLAAECGPGWEAVATACRPYGTVVLAGLGHAGLQGTSAYSQSVLWAPSLVPDVVTRDLPAELQATQLAELTQAFGTAAAAATGAGCQGIELNAATHSLLRQFLSGLTNQRSDAYGSDRTRFLREVIASVRAAIGPDRVLALRLSCDEDAPWAGITPEQTASVVDELADAVDLLTVTKGGYYSSAAYRPNAASAPPMFNRELCKAMRKAAAGRVSVVLQGSVVDPAEAQRALDEEVADLVELTRAQIADPRLVALVRAGTPERVRPCLLCNQACQVRDVRNPLVSCVVEPRAGHELSEPDPDGRDPAKNGRDAARNGCGPAEDVTVVGGGPAGLEAAHVAAARGHRVHLVERTGRLGGVLARSAKGPGRERLKAFTDWQAAECRRYGVRISLNTEATQVDERTILATGALPNDALEAFEGSVPEGPILLDDPIGGPIAIALAEHLATTGHDVTVVTPDALLGARTSDPAGANFRLEALGVKRALRSRAHVTSTAIAELRHIWTDEPREVPCAALIDCGHRLPEDSLRGPYRAGDCVAPRTLLEAVLEGRHRALQVTTEKP